jgi:hypothetical protein
VVYSSFKRDDPREDGNDYRREKKVAESLLSVGK